MSDKHGQITNHLGAILRTLREEKGLTREWVAEHSDTGLRHLAAIELGQKIQVSIHFIALYGVWGFQRIKSSMRNFQAKVPA